MPQSAAEHIIEGPIDAKLSAQCQFLQEQFQRVGLLPNTPFHKIWGDFGLALRTIRTRHLRSAPRVDEPDAPT
jgi:hypothetical protein